MFKKVANNTKMFRVNVYYTVEADNFFGTDFIDVVDEVYVVETDDDDDDGGLLNYFREKFKNQKGYTVSVIPFEENRDHEGLYKIR